MKIIIDNTEFDYNTGCRLFKTKYAECPNDSLADIWNDIIPYTFKEIAQSFQNIEQRRVAINCLGMERLLSEINPISVDKQTLHKRTTWVSENGELIVKEFNDTYELFKVSKEDLFDGVSQNWGMQDAYYVKCKDTSTDREYLIWVEPRSVFNTNNTPKDWYSESKLTAIQAVAWTIQTNVKKGNIEKIIRQGDCILIKPKDKEFVSYTRHLTEEEYRNLLVAES